MLFLCVCQLFFAKKPKKRRAGAVSEGDILPPRKDGGQFSKEKGVVWYTKFSQLL